MLPSCTQAQVLLLLLAITVSVTNCEQEKTIPNSRLNHRLGRWFSWNVPYELIEKEWFGLKEPSANEKPIMERRSDKPDNLFPDYVPSYQNRFEWRFNRL
ncbi:hypothetical protein Aduo_015708 [Ancylostoma duodenale]